MPPSHHRTSRRGGAAVERRRQPSASPSQSRSVSSRSLSTASSRSISQSGSGSISQHETIRNPNTGRRIKVGGATYVRIMKTKRHDVPSETRGHHRRHREDDSTRRGGQGSTRRRHHTTRGRPSASRKTKSTSVVERNQKEGPNYARYFGPILKATNPDFGLATTGKTRLVKLVRHMFDKIARDAEKRRAAARPLRQTLSDGDILSAATHWIRGVIGQFITDDVHDAIKRYVSGKRGTGYVRQEARAGLLFPVGRVATHLRNHFRGRVRLSQTTPVALAAVIENVLTVVLKVAATVARESKHVLITSDDVNEAIARAPQLRESFRSL